jgi:beta-lactamase class A
MTRHFTSERWRPVAVAVALLALAAPAQARPPQRWVPDTHAARLYAQHRPGQIAFAVRTEQRFWGHRADVAFPSASVLKAMLLVAYLREPYVRGRALRPSERALLTPMIRRSDNDAATAIRARIGNGALVRLAHLVGMMRFRPAAIWGLSQITARDQTKFFLHIDRWLPARHRAYGLRLLRTVVPSQRWGVGRVAPAGWELYFKGGWGSGTGRVDHQVALLRRGDERVAVAVLTLADGSHAAGKATLKGVFARLLKDLAGAP